MRRLKRFINRPAHERRLLMRAWLLVAAIRTGLWIAPLDLVRRAAVRCTTNTRRPADAGHIVWAVITGARYFPRATCLTQALAAHAMLAGSGQASRIEIGVAKDSASRFEAHAWVICNDRIVLGGPEVSRYTPLLAFETGARTCLSR